MHTGHHAPVATGRPCPLYPAMYVHRRHAARHRHARPRCRTCVSLPPGPKVRTVPVRLGPYVSRMSDEHRIRWLDSSHVILWARRHHGRRGTRMDARMGSRTGARMGARASVSGCFCLVGQGGNHRKPRFVQGRGWPILYLPQVTSETARSGSVKGCIRQFWQKTSTFFIKATFS